MSNFDLLFYEILEGLYWLRSVIMLQQLLNIIIPCVALVRRRKRLDLDVRLPNRFDVRKRQSFRLLPAAGTRGDVLARGDRDFVSEARHLDSERVSDAFLHLVVLLPRASRFAFSGAIDRGATVNAVVPHVFRIVFVTGMLEHRSKSRDGGGDDDRALFERGSVEVWNRVV